MALGRNAQESAKGNRIVGFVAIGAAIVLAAFGGIMVATGEGLSGRGRLTIPVACIGMVIVAAVAFYNAHRAKVTGEPK